MLKWQITRQLQGGQHSIKIKSYNWGKRHFMMKMKSMTVCSSWDKIYF